MHRSHPIRAIVLVASGCALLGSLPAFAEQVVYFVNGKAITVKSVEKGDKLTILEIEGGGRIGVPTQQILRIEDLNLSPPAAVVAPVSVPIMPAPTPPPAAAQAAPPATVPAAANPAAANAAPPQAAAMKPPAAAAAAVPGEEAEGTAPHPAVAPQRAFGQGNGQQGLAAQNLNRYEGLVGRGPMVRRNLMRAGGANRGRPQGDVFYQQGGQQPGQQAPGQQGQAGGKQPPNASGSTPPAANPGAQQQAPPQPPPAANPPPPDPPADANAQGSNGNDQPDPSQDDPGTSEPSTSDEPAAEDH
jgi:hypothetical protein